MEAQLPFCAKVWVVEEAVGRGLIVVVSAEDMRSSLLCVEATAEWQCLRLPGKSNHQNRPIKHVTNVIARTFPDARRYYHTTNVAQTSHMWTHNPYSLSTIRTDASTTKLPVATHARNSKDFTIVTF